MSGAERFDVIVAGGGMTGGLLAAALAERSRLSVCVLESERPEPFEPGSSPAHDIRVSALSIATERMFRNVGAWHGVTSRRLCPYREMRVWDGTAVAPEAATRPGTGSAGGSTRGGARGGGTHFDAGDIGAEALGHIVENRVVQLALLERLERADTVRLRCPERLADFRVDADEVVVTLESGGCLSARLLVGADGAGSVVRRIAGIPHERTPYDQHALVATIATVLPQQSITWQRFMPTGPQAFLPLTGAHASMVWYHGPDEIERLSALDDERFAREMEAAFPSELGGVAAVLERASFPIARAHARRYVDERVALIGDAAHTVHPLAGQGVNLGMLDAAALAEVVGEAATAGRDIGRGRTLGRYERWRRGENALMIATLDGFHRAFGPQPAPLRALRRAALELADRAAPLKRRVMRRAMGIEGDLPALAR